MSIHVSGVGGWDVEQMGHVNVRIPKCVIWETNDFQCSPFGWAFHHEGQNAHVSKQIGGLPCFSLLKSRFPRPISFQGTLCCA